jgi:hypothetical protein
MLNGVAKLSDLGLAKNRDGSSLRLSRAGGTHGYTDPAPTVEGVEFCPASDVFSFGITAFEALSGHDAFPGLNDRRLERAIEEGTRPDLARLPADLPRAVRDLLERCWALRQGDRPTMAEVVSVLIGVPWQCPN